MKVNHQKGVKSFGIVAAAVSSKPAGISHYIIPDLETSFLKEKKITFIITLVTSMNSLFSVMLTANLAGGNVCRATHRSNQRGRGHYAY